MSGQQIKGKIKDNAIAYAIIALLSSGGGSAVTALRGPDEGKIDAISEDVQMLKERVVRLETKIDFIADNIGHKRVASER